VAGTFIHDSDIQRDQLDWGNLGWVSGPRNGGEQLTILDVKLEPGFGHDFHMHPGQEEVIFVRAGMVEQWLEDKSSELRTGEAVFIPADMVHASFNTGTETAQLVVALGPCVGESGYGLVDVSGEEPWASLRS
jgi:quercetin dioxygenase-like cupin family protein